MERARLLGLEEGAVLIMRYTTSREGGVTRVTYVPDAEPVRGRIDPEGTGGSGGGTAGAAISEATTHVLTLDEEAVLTSQDRVQWHGTTWRVLNVRHRTDPFVQRFEVEEVGA